MPFRPLQAPTSSAGPTPGFRPLSPAPSAQAEPGFFDRIKAGVRQKGNERAETIVAAADANAAGKQGAFRSLFQIGGQLVGGAIDPVLETVKAATPSIVKKGLSTVLKPVSAGVDAVADKVSNIPAVQRFSETPGAAALERDVAATVEYTNLLGGPKAMKVGGQAIKATADVAAKGTKAVANADVAPFKKSFLPKVAAEFESEGITAPISAVSKSPFVQGAEALASKSVFGRNIIEGVRTAQQQIEAKTTAIIERIKPVKSISDENLGKTIQEGLREYEHNFKITEDKVYTDFARRYGDAVAAPYSTVDVLADILRKQGMDFYKGVDPRLVSMLDRLTGETAEVKKLRKDGLPDELIADEKNRAEPDLTFEELKQTRTSVGEQLARDPENAALKRIYGALTEDMRAAVGAADPKEGTIALQKLDADYKAGKQKIESRIAQSIEQSNPERIAQNIITRNSAQTLRVLKEMIGTSRFDEISKAFLREMFEGSLTRGKFDLDKLKRNLGQYDQDTLDQVLNVAQQADLKEAMIRLEKMQRLTEALRPGQKFAEGSQTAFLQNITGSGARVAGILTAILSGNVPLATSIMFGTGVEAAYAKLFTSEAGRKFLSGGFKKPKTRPLREALVKKP